jgi:predicted metal-dependent peptidase
MSIIEGAIDKIQYTDKLGRLCHRILKNCVVRENTTLDSPARVFSSNKNMFIEINTNDAFFKNEKHVMFALMHEALHIAFGHMFLDTSIYDMEKLNISFDASINPYILSFIDNKYVAPVSEYTNGLLFSGFSYIQEKNTWEYIYNNFPQKDQEEQEEQEQEDSKQEDSEQEEQDKNEEQSESKKEESSTNEEEENDTSTDGSGDKQLDVGSGNTTRDPQSESTEDSGANIAGGPRSGDSDDKRLDINELRKGCTFDSHEFVEMPSKATEAVMQETVLTAMEELGIEPGSALGSALVKGLSFYQTAKQKWRRALSMAVLKAIKIKGHEATWKRPNRRNNRQDMPIPGKRKLYYPSIGVLVDCSGSMVRYVNAVLNHIASITSEVGGIDYLIGGDTETRISHKNINKKKLQKIEFEGFGGTFLTNMINELVCKPTDIIIIITDMELRSTDIETINNITRKKATILCVPDTEWSRESLSKITHAKIIKIDEER